MNKVIKAEKEKIAAIDFATAAETKADGERRAAIKAADGEKQAKILQAEGEAQAITKVAVANAGKIKVESEAASRYFKGNAVVLKKLETAENVLSENTKVIVPSGSNVVNVVGDTMGLLPLDGVSKVVPKRG